MKNSKVLLLPNAEKDDGLQLTRRLARFLDRTGHEAYVLPEVSVCLADEPVQSLDEIASIDLLVPIGGDGTIIGAIRRFKDALVPVLGINLGDVGFLAEVEPDRAEEALGLALSGNCRTEERILLEGQIEKADGTASHTFTAMNDVLINRHMMASLIGMSVYINGQLIDHYLGDGLIICTPTGSTAYNLSAGGPIVAPSAKNLVITPLCVHSLNIRSIVTSEEDAIEVRISEGKNDGSLPTIVSIDGQKNEWLMPGDRVFLSRSRRAITLIKVSDHTFYQTLKKKLF